LTRRNAPDTGSLDRRHAQDCLIKAIVGEIWMKGNRHRGCLGPRSSLQRREAPDEVR